MKQATMNHLILLAGIILDGVLLGVVLAIVEDMDSKQLMIGPSSLDLEITLTLKEELQFQEQMLKEQDSLHLENHVLQIQNSVIRHHILQIGVEST